MSIKDVVYTLLSDPDSQLSEGSCAGYPYLVLNHYDYNLKHSKETYDHFVGLIKKYGYDNNWHNANCCFFDVHPILSDASPINGIMGLHLSLTLFDNGVAGKSQNLYFDTLSNWRKFSRISEKRVYPTSSWIMFRYSDVAGEDEDDDSDEIQRSDYYFKTSINLIKGNELNAISKYAPTDFNSKILNYFSGDEGIKPTNHREALIQFINEYEQYIDYDLKNYPSLRVSALYLFSVIFCREFGFDYEIFRSVVAELGLKFDFLNNNDIIHYTGKSVGFTQNIHLKIGNYEDSFITYEQSDVYTFSFNESNVEVSVNDEGDVENLGLSDIKEQVKNQSLKGVRFFYKMDQALTSESECKNKIYNYWRELTLCFYHGKLNQNTYNKLRNIMDSHVDEEMKREKVLMIENYDIQESAMKMCAFNIFINTEFDLNIISQDSSACGIELYKNLSTPILTDDQLAAINLLNTTAQKKLTAEIMSTHKENLVVALNTLVDKVGHTTLSKFHGPRLSRLDKSTMRYLIIKWYIDNYITEYRKFTNKFEDIYAYILRDIGVFEKNPFAQESILKEVRNLLPVKYNPYLILDFNTNY